MKKNLVDFFTASPVFFKTAIIFFFLSFASASVFSQTASVSTDQQDYPPGSTVNITGSGFTAGETVTLQVLHVGESADNQTSAAHQPWTATADSTGSITTTWVVPPDQDEFGATLQLTASGQTSRMTAVTTFTDAGPVVVSVSTAAYGGTATFTASSFSGMKTIAFQLGGLAFPNGGVKGTDPVQATIYLTSDGLTKSASNTWLPAGTYTVSASGNGVQTGSTTFTIDKRQLTVTATGVNRTYDGTTIASITLNDNRLTGDVLTAAYTSATFVNKNVGTAKPVTVSGISISGAAAGNYTFNTTTSATANITARPLAIAATGINKVYDGNTTATVSLSDNKVSGDAVTDAYTAATFADKNVANGKAVSVIGISISGTDAGNYSFNNTASTTADISKKALTVTATGINKEYDGTTAATVSLSDNKVSGDAVTDAYTAATFADKNVANGKAVSVIGISISGTDAGNYSFNNTASTTADISKKALTVTATGINKEYDGTTAATVSLSDNKVSGDAVTDAYTAATFADKNVANGKAVSVTGISISGADAGNYSFNNTASTTADISKKALTVTATGINKEYDGTTAATVSLSDNKVSGDAVTDAYTAATFADKNVANGKAVSVTGISISGADAGNYSFNTTASTTADISKKALTVTAAGINKEYDGTTAATVSLSDNKVSGDAVTDAYTAATFADKNVANDKAVSVTGISISGADIGNYSFNTTASTTADISKKALTVTATGINKEYDGTTAATVSLSDNKVSGDAVTDAYTAATFADKNVANGKVVSVSGISISGADIGNYTFNTTASTTANITARPLAITATGINKVYDGNPTATVSLSDNKVSGDAVTDAYTAATFADKNVANGKVVSVSGISISGADIGNYTFNTTASATANITARPLAIAATGINKVYDGNTTATVSLSDNKVSGDAVTDAYTAATFADKNVANGKVVSVTGISISGADIGNYTFNTTASTTANITARPLAIAATGINKVYDGNTTATVSLSDNKVSGDAVTDAYTAATFADKNVANGKVVSVSGISISGADIGNYTFNTTASATANITARPLAIAATGINKVYDGNTTATVSLSDNKVSGDAVTDAYTAATFADKNVANGKVVSVSGISISGADIGNYTFNTTASTTANITARPLAITATGINKVYDGNTIGTVSLSDNKVNGDAVTDAYVAASFADKNVGTGKPVSVSGISISGTDATNYSLTNTTASATADITARSLTVTAKGIDKVYDGNTTATVSLSDNKVSGDAVTDAYTTAAFADKNVANGKVVSVTGISISGADMGNYTFNTTASTTANITARPLAITATGINKVYDGNPTATVSLSDNKVSGDAVTDAYTAATFADKNVANGKVVSVSGISISGADIGNYTFNTTASATANITARPLAIAATGINKVYDGNTTATVSLSDNKVSGDAVTDAYTAATFADKNVANGKVVSVSGISISGADIGNYTFNTTASATANITARPLAIAATGINKVYDGNTTATVSLSDNKVSGDAVTDAYTAATFADKNVANGKVVSVTGISISGADIGNYTFNTTASTTANITARPLAIAATGINKVYDGNTTATVSLSDNKVNGDAVTDAYVAASFADKNVGTGKPVSVSGISISGTDATNYSLTNTTASATADITARSLTVTAKGIDKVYDGTTAATVTLSDNKVSGDAVSDAYTKAVFVNSIVGTNITVNVSGISISGIDAPNYSLSNTTATTSANIKPDSICASYNGITFANTDISSTGTSLSTTNVKLSIVINTAGSIDARSAAVTFATDISGAPYAAQLDPSSTINQAIFFYNMPVNIGSNLSQTSLVWWTIGGNFINSNSCTDINTNITVSTRSADFVTGGGYVALNASAGTYKGAAGTKNNFGFNVKWNKNFSNIQGGGFNSIVRNGNLTYQIKAAKVLTLVVTPASNNTPATAAFTSGNATLTVTNANTGAIVSSIGNANLTVELTDVCEPGSGSKASSDLIGITLKDTKGNLLYSNNWNTATSKTIQHTLDGGNLQIHNDANTPAGMCTSGLNTTAALPSNPSNITSVNNLMLKDLGAPLNVTVYPNPTVSNFNVHTEGGSSEKVDVLVSDVLGHLLKSYKVSPGSSITLGDNLATGLYIIQVRQGQTYKYYRVYKTGY